MDGIRTFRVDSGVAAKVRDILHSRVRLTFTERSRFWSGNVVFIVTGPAFAIESAAVDIDRAVEDWEWAIRW